MLKKSFAFPFFAHILPDMVRRHAESVTGSEDELQRFLFRKRFTVCTGSGTDSGTVSGLE